MYFGPSDVPCSFLATVWYANCHLATAMKCHDMSWWCRYHVWRPECQCQAGLRLLAWCGSYHWLEIDWIPWDSITQIALIYGLWQCPSQRFRGEKRVLVLMFVRFSWKQVRKAHYSWPTVRLDTILLADNHIGVLAPVQFAAPKLCKWDCWNGCLMLFAFLNFWERHSHYCFSRDQSLSLASLSENSIPPNLLDYNHFPN